MGHLTGGFVIGKEFPIPIGSFVSSNLTPAGQLRRWSDGEIFRAIRNAVYADGRRLIIMSYTNAGKLSDDDIKALIAYLRRTIMVKFARRLWSITNAVFASSQGTLPSDQ